MKKDSFRRRLKWWLSQSHALDGVISYILSHSVTSTSFFASAYHYYERQLRSCQLVSDCLSYNEESLTSSNRSDDEPELIHLSRSMTDRQKMEILTCRESGVENLCTDMDESLKRVILCCVLSISVRSTTRKVQVDVGKRALNAYHHQQIDSQKMWWFHL